MRSNTTSLNQTSGGITAAKEILPADLSPTTETFPPWTWTATPILLLFAGFLFYFNFRRNNAMAIVAEIHLFLKMLFEIIYYSIIGALKALLPLRLLPQKSIRGKIVLITGSGSGLGRLMAREFGKLGATIVLWDINEKLNAQTKTNLDKLGVKSFEYSLDLSDSEQISSVAKRVKQEVGDPDILVNNAGIVSGKKIFECSGESMEKTMAVNCNALFFTAKAFLPAMMDQRQGHIVNIASLAGIAGVNGLVDYCASKHGAVGFSEALRAEMLALGMPITVTTVCPYYVSTGMFEGVKTFSPRMFPILEPEYVVDNIVRAVLVDADELYLPWTANLVVALKGFMPAKAMHAMGDYFGFSHTMDDFKGRQHSIPKAA